MVFGDTRSTRYIATGTMDGSDDEESKKHESDSSCQSSYQNASSDESSSSPKRTAKPKREDNSVPTPKRKLDDGVTASSVKPEKLIDSDKSFPVVKKTKKPKKATINTTGTFDIVVPSSGAESLLFVQLDGAESETNQLEGAIGAIGRLEQVDDSGGKYVEMDKKCSALLTTVVSVFFDIQGVQYSGTMLPGPSLLLLTQRGSDLRLEGVADDFVLATSKQSKHREHDKGMYDTFVRNEDDVNARGVKGESTVKSEYMK